MSLVSDELVKVRGSAKMIVADGNNLEKMLNANIIQDHFI